MASGLETEPEPEAEAAPDLALGSGAEARPQGQSAFLAQAAARRPVNEPPSVFVALGENGQKVSDGEAAALEETDQKNNRTHY